MSIEVVYTTEFTASGGGRDGHVKSADSRIEQRVADESVQQAHQVCPYSRATRGNVDVSAKV